MEVVINEPGKLPLKHLNPGDGFINGDSVMLVVQGDVYPDFVTCVSLLSLSAARVVLHHPSTKVTPADVTVNVTPKRVL